MSSEDVEDINFDEFFDMTQAWSRYNDNIYIIANQLLSLVFAYKYFGNNKSKEKLLKVCEAFFQELDNLQHLLENKSNFSFDRVYHVLMDTLVLNKNNDTDDVLVEENISDIARICPISRKPITQPVSQVLAYGEDSCNHVFDYVTIMQYIRNSNGFAVDCPIAACMKRVYCERLHRDWETVHLKRYQQYINIYQEIQKEFGDQQEEALYLL